jgi:hypothetical protein
MGVETLELLIGDGGGWQRCPYLARVVATSAPPVNCCHHPCVCLSYLTRSLLRTLPVVPKSSSRAATLRSKSMAALHNGQKVTATGVSPGRSLTIS